MVAPLESSESVEGAAASPLHLTGPEPVLNSALDPMLKLRPLRPRPDEPVRDEPISLPPPGMCRPVGDSLPRATVLQSTLLEWLLSKEGWLVLFEWLLLEWLVLGR
jgi:hypothetical protein